MSTTDRILITPTFGYRIPGNDCANIFQVYEAMKVGLLIAAYHPFTMKLYMKHEITVPMDYWRSFDDPTDVLEEEREAMYWDDCYNELN